MLLKKRKTLNGMIALEVVCAVPGHEYKECREDPGPINMDF
jgi:hypothetical protein